VVQYNRKNYTELVLNFSAFRGYIVVHSGKTLLLPSTDILWNFVSYPTIGDPCLTFQRVSEHE
jgi:hypothetical protein